MEKKTDFKALSGKAKVQYVWDYYRWPIIITVITAAVLGSLIHHFVTYQEPLLNVIMINNPSALNTTEDGFIEFLTDAGYEYEEDSILLVSDLNFPEDGQGADYNNYMALSTMIAAGGQDLFFGTGTVFLNYADVGALADLSDILSPELLEKYADQLIYSTNDGAVEAYPCAVELTDHEWLKKYNYYDTCYFGVFASAQNPQLAAQFADFLLNYEEMP